MNWKTKKTWLHQVNPSNKLLSVFLFFFLFLWIEQWQTMAIVLATSGLVFLFLSGFTHKHYAILLPAILLIFISVSLPMILYGKGTTIWYEWAWIKISAESVNQGLLISFRTLSLTLWSLLFTVSTKPVALFYSLMQQWKLKPTYAYGFMAVLNLFPQLKKDLDQRRLVEKMVKRKRSYWEKLSFYTLPLLSQAIRKAFLTAVAMEAKGFSMESQRRTYYYTIGYNKFDVLYICFIFLFVFCYILIN